MSQKAVPVSDISKGGWQSQAGALDPLYPQLDLDLSGSGDPDYVFSTSDPSGDAFTVQLGRLYSPLAGQYLLRVRMKRNGPSSVPVAVALYGGRRKL